MTSCLLSGDNAKQVVLNPGMTTDWVLVIVLSSYNASVDANPVLESKLVARKDPEGENIASRGAFPT
jgi:hypothetical protein